MRTTEEVRAFYDARADEVERWRYRRAYYHDRIADLARSVIRPGLRVLDIGCGLGDLLAALAPARGLGVDLSPALVERARRRHPGLEFRVGDAQAIGETIGGEAFDAIVLSNVIGEVSDVWRVFRSAREVARPETRLLVVYYNWLWEPALRLGEKIGLRMPQPTQNWLPIPDVENLLDLAGWETVRTGHRCLLPLGLPGADLANRWLAPLPLLRRLGLVSFVLARPEPHPPRPLREATVTVLVPCRNERENIEPLVRRVPRMGRHTEILFVDGASDDGTLERIRDVAARCRGLHEIRWIEQGGALGKRDAVWKGFEAARGEILMILDADLTVAPEDLPKFYLALVEGRGEFVNGSRLVYRPDPGAFRTLNLAANALFARGFSAVLSARIRDTLCGTKALWRRDWERMPGRLEATGDPFGDFDLLLGAARLGLKIIEIPVRYTERTYGETKIRRFRNGVDLARRLWRGAREILFR